MSIGIPLKTLHEAVGHTVTIEMKTGELYRGRMVTAEDNMNCSLDNITYTARDGRTAQLASIYLRGSKIRFFIIPDMIKNAPFFQPRQPGTRTGAGTRGMSAKLRAEGVYARESPLCTLWRAFRCSWYGASTPTACAMRAGTHAVQASLVFCVA